MTDNIPARPANSFRVTITLDYGADRMDTILLHALKKQNDNEKLKNISRTALKNMFAESKIMIKGQRAKPSSALAKGITYVDILEA